MVALFRRDGGLKTPCKWTFRNVIYVLHEKKRTTTILLWERLVVELFHLFKDSRIQLTQRQKLPLRSAARINVKMTPTVPSTMALSLGARTRQGMTAVL